MSTSFNTHIKSAAKSIHLLFITGSLSLTAGILLLFSNVHYTEFCGALFSLSGLSMSIFTLRNYKILNGWGGYFLFAVLIMIAGGYISLYKTSDFFTGWIALLRSGVLFGAALDFKRLGHKDWKNIGVTGGISLLFSVILIADPRVLYLPTRFVVAVLFITTGLASLLIFSELKKVNEFHGLLRKLMKNAG
ncbi:hypothetical protein BAS10_12235 [Elizabethkingia meningoseptica]|uniref:hypothetical protein n=1 Tax=Elizabethkingia meningoseptica TaxID=238 RepID=UPI00099ADB2B|nr:hypothetical protein [Elizabethkingia meningoseptica]OPB95131.1 hypothetical protein BAS10_12235 [Elizabethkingia meningoseptica]